jgi:hypothetical protein
VVCLIKQWIHLRDWYLVKHRGNFIFALPFQYTQSELGTCLAFSSLEDLIAVSQNRRLIPGISLRRPGFYPRAVHVGFVVDKWHWGRFSSSGWYSRLTLGSFAKGHSLILPQISLSQFLSMWPSASEHSIIALFRKLTLFHVCVTLETEGRFSLHCLSSGDGRPLGPSPSHCHPKSTFTVWLPADNVRLHVFHLAERIITNKL